MNWVKNPQTLCLGRFVVQMPADLEPLSKKYKYNGSEIETTPGVSRRKFDYLIQTREQELTDQKRDDSTLGKFTPTTIPWLEKAVSPQPDSRLLVYQDFENRKRNTGYDTEGYVWRDKTMFFLKSSATADKVPLAMAYISDVMGRIKARDNATVPTEAGYCFDGGLMTGGTKFFEFAKAYFKRPDTPGDLVFGIEMRPNLESDDKLLDRVPRLMQMMGNLVNHTRTLRRGDRSLAGLDGQEMLTKINADGVTAYYFIWEFMGKEGSVIHPNTHIELRIGGQRVNGLGDRQSAVLSEEDALVLWDELLNSLRLRPGAV
jgi:hypothetical protein